MRMGLRHIVRQPVRPRNHTLEILLVRDIGPRQRGRRVCPRTQSGRCARRRALEPRRKARRLSRVVHCVGGTYALDASSDNVGYPAELVIVVRCKCSGEENIEFEAEDVSL